MQDTNHNKRQNTINDLDFESLKKRRRLTTEIPYRDTDFIKGLKLLVRFFAQKALRRFYFNVIKPRGLKSIAEKFCKYGLSLEEVKNIPFEDLSIKLRSEQIIDASCDMLLKVIQLSNWNRKTQPLITGIVNVKIYLVAYMIFAYPNHVFESIEELEQKLLDATKPFLVCIHQTADALQSGKKWADVKKEVAKDLHVLLCAYLRSFKTWKIIDEKKLGKRLRHVLNSLDKKLEAATANNDTLLCTGIQTQRQRIINKIKQIAGDKEIEEHYKQHITNPITTPAIIAKTNNTDLEASQPVRTEGITNEQLAHELLLDPNFKICDNTNLTEEKLVHTKIRDIYERAFWDSLVDDLQNTPPSYTRILKVLIESRDTIQSLSQGHPESLQIQDIIDNDLIIQQLRNNTFDLKDCYNLFNSIVDVIVSIHTRMKATERKQETIVKWQSLCDELQAITGLKLANHCKLICNALEFIMERIHVIRADTANNKLRAIAPVIQAHGIEYERSHFKKKLQQNKINIELTKQWLQHTIDNVFRNRDSRVSLDRLIGGSHDDYESILYMSIINLVIDYPNWGNQSREKDQIPETMLLDSLRIIALNKYFHNNIVSAVTLITVSQEIKTRMRDGIVRSQLLRTIGNIVVNSNNTAEMIKKVLENLEEHLNKQAIGTINTLINKHKNKSHPVYFHIAKVFKSLWFKVFKNQDNQLSNYNIESDARSLITISDSVKEIIKQTQGYASSLKKIAVLNRQVHVAMYNKIIFDYIENNKDKLTNM